MITLCERVGVQTGTYWQVLTFIGEWDLVSEHALDSLTVDDVGLCLLASDSALWLGSWEVLEESTGNVDMTVSIVWSDSWVGTINFNLLVVSELTKVVSVLTNSYVELNSLLFVDWSNLHWALDLIVLNLKC